MVRNGWVGARRLAGVAAVLGCCVGNGLGAQQPAANETGAVRPLQTELIGPLDGTRVHPGSPVLARVDLDWSAPGCQLHAGSIVQGRVVEVTRRSRQVKNAELQLVFDAADCDGHPGVARRFSLVALVGSTAGAPRTGQSGVNEAPPLAQAVGLSVAGGIRSADTASGINTFSVQPVRSLPRQVLPGQVVDLRRVNLSVGTGVDGATVVIAVGHDARLEAGTSLILVPRAAGDLLGAGAATPTGRVPTPVVATAPKMEGRSGPAATSAAVTTVVAEPPDETEMCSKACNLVGGIAGAEAAVGETARARLSIRALGYAPRVHRQVPTFDDETTLTYLDAHNLLCTFDPHQLRQRMGANEEVARTVRAVLIDPQTQTVKRVVEWRVRGVTQYLWRLSNGRVLVHMGHELRVFDAELHAIHSIPVEGRVAWVAVSPSSDVMAVGTIREQYADFVYREIESRSSEVPSEDVQVRVFDRAFRTMLTTHRSSHMQVPVLSDAGELRVAVAGRERWKISEVHWDRTERPMLTVRSTCRPVLSTPEHGLIFAVGCLGSGGRWYRMLRPDGRPVLKGDSPSDELEQSALGMTDGVFAVRIVKAARSMSYGQPFDRSDLTREQIAVYRSADGASVASVSSDDFALSQLGYALSPSGDQMALVGRDAVLFFPVRSLRP